MKQIQLRRGHRTKKQLFNSGGFNNVHRNQIVKGLDFLTQNISSTPDEHDDNQKEDEFMRDEDYGAMVRSFTLNKINDCDKFLTKSPTQIKGKIQAVVNKSETRKKNLIDEK